MLIWLIQTNYSVTYIRTSIIYCKLNICQLCLAKQEGGGRRRKGGREALMSHCICLKYVGDCEPEPQGPKIEVRGHPA